MLDGSQTHLLSKHFSLGARNELKRVNIVIVHEIHNQLCLNIHSMVFRESR